MSRVFGVNIGAGSLGLSVSETSFGRVRQLKNEDVVIPDQEAERAKTIGETLARWKKEYGPHAAVVGLPLRHFTCKVLEMPKLSRNELRGALFFELEKHLPLPVDEYLFDYAVREHTPGAEKTLQATVLAVRKDLVEKNLKPFEEAGIPVTAVCCATTAALAAVLEAGAEPKFSGMLFYGNDDDYELALVDRGLPVFFRRIGRDADAVHGVEQLRQGHPGMVYSAGTVDQSITERLGCKKFFVNIPTRLSAAARRRSPLDLNFLPQEMLGPKRDYYPVAIGGLAAASVLLFLATGVLAYVLCSQSLSQMQARVHMVKTKAAGLIEAKKKADQLVSDEAALQSFSQSGNSSIRLLVELSEAIPAHSWIVNFSIDDKGKVEIEGISKKTSEVIVALEKSKKVKNVAFSAPITYKDGEERFTIRMEPAE